MRLTVMALAGLGCLLPASQADAGATASPRPEAGESTERSPVRSRTVRIEKVEIRGREQVSTAQIGHVLEEEGLIEGADLMIPEDSRVDRARERLRATGYFRLVNIRFRPVAGRRDSAVLIVELEERSSVHVSDVYLGTSRMTPFRGGLVVEERNFLGRAVHLGGGFLWSTLPQIDKARRQQAYRLFAEAPRVGAAPFGVLGSAYLISASEPYRVRGAANDPTPAHFRTFDYDRAGGVLGLSFPLLPQLTLGVDYGFERVDAILPTDPVYMPPHDPPLAVELDVLDGVHRHTAAHFSLLWDGREDAALAGHGARFVLDLQVSSPAIGSEYEYIKLAASGAYTFRLPWRHWMTPSFSGGQITGDAPRFEQFFSGDLSDWTPGREQELRFSTRNPIDVLGLDIDTRTFGALFGRLDLEYVWPLFRRTRTRSVYGGDLFLSTGIYTIVGDADEREARDAAGERIVPLGFNANFGLRLDTPLGTLDLSVGNVLRRAPL